MSEDAAGPPDSATDADTNLLLARLAGYRPVTPDDIKTASIGATVSDNAEARKALAGHLVHGFNGSQVLCQCREDGWLTRQGYMDHLLAALPPVAAPEVRPDETLRAAVQALCDEAVTYLVSDLVGRRIVVRAVPVSGLRVALAAPAPAPGDEGQTEDARAYYAEEDETPPWLVALLTEASGAAHGNPNTDSLMAVIRDVPEAYVADAGLLWALPPSFDDDAPADSPDPAATEVGEGER